MRARMASVMLKRSGLTRDARAYITQSASLKRDHVSLMAAAYPESIARREAVTLTTASPDTGRICNPIIR